MTGIVCLDKPQGLTSFAAVARVRRILGVKKAGHAGTLDPMATGVLPVLLSGATRFAELLPTQDKGYRAVIRLGIVTNTLDITGQVLAEHPVTATADDVRHAAAVFFGDIEQVPPMVSALKQNGVRLYELARRGIEVERPARPVTICQLEMTAFDDARHEFTLEVLCSKGTYIRSLARDIGEVLGCGGTLIALRRTFAAGLPIGSAVTLEQLEAHKAEGTLPSVVIPVEKLLESYPGVTVSPAQAVRFCNGGALDLQRLPIRLEVGLHRVYSTDGGMLGLGEVFPARGELAVKRLLIAD